MPYSPSLKILLWILCKITKCLNSTLVKQFSRAGGLAVSSYPQMMSPFRFRISWFFGTTFLSLGFTLLLLSVFALGLYNGLDEFKTGLPGVVKDSIREYGYENLLNDNEQLR